MGTLITPRTLATEGIIRRGGTLVSGVHDLKLITGT